MKTIGFVDYYISEWHANNYPQWIKEESEKLGENFVVKYAWAELDKSLVDGVTTEEWCNKFGVEKCNTIGELCEKADYILVLAPSDLDKHLGYAKEVFKFKKNTYIDKTFAPDYKTAKEIFDLAEKYGVKFFSSSALRYSNELDLLPETNNIITHGGGGNLDEYIIHQIEMVVKCLGVGMDKVCYNKVADTEWADVVYTNGKSAKMMFAPCMPFAITVSKNDGKSAYMSINSEFFKGLIADIFNFFQTGETSFDAQETLEIMKIREAVIKAKAEVGNG